MFTSLPTQEDFGNCLGTLVHFATYRWFAFQAKTSTSRAFPSKRSRIRAPNHLAELVEQSKKGKSDAKRGGREVMSTAPHSARSARLARSCYQLPASYNEAVHKQPRDFETILEGYWDYIASSNPGLPLL